MLRPARQCTVLASRRCRVAGQHHLPTCTTRQPLPPGRALTYRVKGVLKASKTAERQQGEGRCAQQAALPAGVIGDVPPWQVRRDRLLHPLYSVAWALRNRRRQQNLTQVGYRILLTGDPAEAGLVAQAGALAATGAAAEAEELATRAAGFHVAALLGRTFGGGKQAGPPILPAGPGRSALLGWYAASSAARCAAEGAAAAVAQANRAGVRGEFAELAPVCGNHERMGQVGRLRTRGAAAQPETAGR